MRIAGIKESVKRDLDDYVNGVERFTSYVVESDWKTSLNDDFMHDKALLYSNKRYLTQYIVCEISTGASQSFFFIQWRWMNQTSQKK